MSEQDERPVHHAYDCSTGETTVTPFTDGEWAEHRKTAATEAASMAALQAEDEALRTAVAAHPDPVVQALAKRAGLA